MRLSDFLNTVKPREWLVEGLIPRGHIVLMAGDEGSGKSWIIDGLAVSLASGRYFADGFSVKRSSVILIDEDTPRDEFGDRLRRLAAGLNLDITNLPLDVRSSEGFMLDDDSKLTQLRTDIGALNPPVVIIIDCLGKVTKRNLNSADECNEIGRRLGVLRSAGATVLLVHHFGKREGDTRIDFKKKVRGSGAIIGNSDTGYGIEGVPKPKPDSPTRFIIHSIERRARLGVEPVFAIELEDTEDFARLMVMEEMPAEPSEVARLVFGLFAGDRTLHLSVAQAIDRIGKDRSEPDIREAFHELHRQEVLQLEIGAHGKYVYALDPYIFHPLSLGRDYWDALGIVPDKLPGRQ